MVRRIVLTLILTAVCPWIAPEVEAAPPTSQLAGKAAPTTAPDSSAPDTADRLENEYSTDIRPLLKKYCRECHAGQEAEAELDLDRFPHAADIPGDLPSWLRIRRILETRQMPPPDSPQPTEPELSRLAGWVRAILAREAAAHAGDPGPVMLRRLTNAEYTWSIRDLTGLNEIDPTREFPVDGAAGEGFTNVGLGQGMSPALVQKYLDAAKQVSQHMVLLPDGIRFSPSSSRQDQTDQILADIQAFYRRFTADGGGTTVNLTGKPFTTNQGGLLPLERYLAVMITNRDAIRAGRVTLEQLATQHELSSRYLRTLWDALEQPSGNDSPPLKELRRHWRTANSATQLIAWIRPWQDALWQFHSIGHLGRAGGPTAWMESRSPIATSLPVEFEIPEVAEGEDVVLYLCVSDLDDGNENDFVLWQRPRLAYPAANDGSERPVIPLNDIQNLVPRVRRLIATEQPRSSAYLAALVELKRSGGTLSELAAAHRLHAGLLERWATLAGVSTAPRRQITGHLREKLTRVRGYEAINGWGTETTPSLLTNSSQAAISFLTLTVPARGVTVHPAPNLDATIAWRSPRTMRLRVEGQVADSDDKCGNGATWQLTHVTDSGTMHLLQGQIENGDAAPFHTDQTIQVEAGDVIQLTIGARSGNHSCDTTHVDLKLTETDGKQQTWDLADDVVDRIASGNPLADSYGHPETWHFCATGGDPDSSRVIPPESALAGWAAAFQNDAPPDQLLRLARQVELSMTTTAPDSLAPADQELQRVLGDWLGPLGWVALCLADPRTGQQTETDAAVTGSEYGLPPALFGRHPLQRSVEPDDLCLQAPYQIAVRLPAQLATDARLLSVAVPSGDATQLATVQVKIRTESDERLRITPSTPMLIAGPENQRQRFVQRCDQFRDLFPPALCYARIVPVDEVVTLTLYHREDQHLQRLMLEAEQIDKLNRLWDELSFVSQEPLKLVVAFEQISEFATQDRPDVVKAFAPLQQPILERAAAFRQRQLQAEPRHVRAVVTVADRAWRRSLTAGQRQELEQLYDRLRQTGVAHEPAVRLLLARVLTSPAFLFKLEAVPDSDVAQLVGPDELAVRLSYFLWSSMPDAPLRQSAATGELMDVSELRKQTHRMLRDPRTRRLAVQFACQWLHVRDFDETAEKNEKLYPEFVELRSDMYEETVRFFEDMFRHNGSVLDILNADHTFLNARLARHYGIPSIPASGWHRTTGILSTGRGGVLGMATVLASQSGTSRTSPILRGNWVSETLLGERLPKPPPNVPQLPDAPPAGLTARQLIEQHSSVAECARCHARIDPYGFALEQFDTVGRLRAEAVDTRTTLVDGKSIEGIAGLRHYLLQDRRDAVIEQFCRKLLGYALGREVQLSDEPLLAEMHTKLKTDEYRFHTAVDTIISSPQFRMIRGSKQQSP